MEQKNLKEYKEVAAKTKSGFVYLFLNFILLFIAIAAIVLASIKLSDSSMATALGVIVIVIGSIYCLIISPILFAGLKIVKPNEAIVLTLFGKYYGTVREPGYYYVNPFSAAVSPSKKTHGIMVGKVNKDETSLEISPFDGKKISLKTMTLNNEKQKINDALGNPIIIGIVVIWKVTNTAKAIFNVDDYPEFLSIQCDSALRNIVRLYPYDSTDSDNEKSLRGSSQEISLKLKQEIQEKVEIAGLEISEARITHLAYAPEIAAAMLQRQQASAIIDARQMIVEGAVGMVDMALEQLQKNAIVELDEERKAAMVSNLLVVLCGNKDAQPIVNSGTIY